MADGVRAALAALRGLEYAPFALLIDLLGSDEAFCAQERNELCSERRAIIQRLVRAAPAPNAHTALDTLDVLEYPPYTLVRDITHSKYARCARARQNLSDNAVPLLNLLLHVAPTPFDRILAFLDMLNVSPHQLILDLLECTRPAVSDAISAAIPAILPLLTRCNEPAFSAWSLQYARQLYTAELLKIPRKDAGPHANA